MSDLIRHPALDFSGYQPGDVIAIDMNTIRDLGQAQSTLMIMHIANAATRAGLGWEVVRHESDDMIRVRFKEEQGE